VTITLHHTDCLAWLAAYEGPLFDSCVTDPPYHLTSIVKRFGKAGSAEAKVGATGAYARASKGFMGKEWDGGDIAFRPETWRAVFDVLKPGAHLVAFSGTRTYHRMVCAIEDAGFEIRDMISWVFGSGFPKNHNVGKVLAEWEGWGTALKPALEPICFARKPLIGTVAENVLAHRTGAINIDGCRVPVGDDAYARNCSADRGHADNRKRDMDFGMTAGSASAIGRHPANVVHDGSPEVVGCFPAEAGAFAPVRGTEPSNAVTNVYGERTRVATLHHGDSGSAARFFSSFPMEEDQCLLQKSASDAPQPLSLQSEAVVSALSDAVTRSTQRLALNFQDYRAQNIPVSESELRIACEAVTEAIQCIERRFLLGLRQESITVKLGHVTCAATQSPTGTTTITISLSTSDHYADHVTFSITETSADRGAPDFAAKRFHYSAKADADDRLGSKHPTVKPVSLMRWLVRLVTPPGGTVLDPFAGTGTTGHAALLEGFNAVLIEREEEYRADIARRMGLVFAGEVERAHAIVKARGEEEGHESLPLFGGAS